MNTKINLTYKGEQYTLEYNRMSIKMLEKAGFEYDKFLDQPVTNIELAFTGAFVKNHPKIQQTLVDEIYDSCPNKDKLVAAISKMINECYESLLADPGEKAEGNASWEVVDLSPKKNEKAEK